MSNKPKKEKRLQPYERTKGEQKHYNTTSHKAYKKKKNKLLSKAKSILSMIGF